MNIYEKNSIIYVSPNGRPNGWNKLGADPLITEENKKYVIGYAVGKAIFDTERMAEDAKPKVPAEISLRQFHLALLESGDYDEILSAVASAPRAIQIEFNTAQSVRRDWPSLVSMASLLGWSSEEVDEIFILGGSL